MNKLWFFLTLAAAGLPLGGLASASAEELSYRGITHNVAANVQPVGDAEGHVIGVAKFSGLAFVADGRVATTQYVVTFDYVGGNGPWQAYHTLAFDDGSTLWMKVDGTSTTEGNKTALAVVETTVIGGTGAFANASGKGRAGPSGWRIAPMADGGDTYYDVVLDLN